MSDSQVHKKRKRHSEGDIDDAPRKQGGGGRPRSKVKITLVDKDVSTKPVVAIAPGMILPKKATFKAFHKRDASHDELLLHSSEHPRLDYTGREHSNGAANPSTIQHYLAVFDSKTLELELVPSKPMHIRSTLRSEEEEMRKAKEERELNGLSQRQALGMEFGTRKAKKAIESLSQNAVSPRKRGEQPETGAESVKNNPGASAVIDSMAAAAEALPSKEAMQAEVDENKPRPKHNANAERPRDAYPIDDVIGEPTMISIKVKPWRDAAHENKRIDDLTSRFVSNRVHALGKADEIPRLKVLKYVGSLVDFYSALKPEKGGGKSLPPRAILQKAVKEAPSVIDGIKAKFTNGKGQMTKWHVDLLMTHLAVYSLIADDFSTDIYDLTQDLGKEIKEMKQYFLEIGARCETLKEREWVKAKLTKETARGHLMAKLVLPLKFPKLRIIPQGRGRR